MIKMRWLIILFLLFSGCKKNRPLVNYEPLTEEELNCVFKNVKPIDENSSEIDDDYIVVFDGKYYNWVDPEFQKCLKDYKPENTSLKK